MRLQRTMGMGGETSHPPQIKNYTSHTNREIQSQLYTSELSVNGRDTIKIVKKCAKENK